MLGASDHSCWNRAERSEPAEARAFRTPAKPRGRRAPSLQSTQIIAAPQGHSAEGSARRGTNKPHARSEHPRFSRFWRFSPPDPETRGMLVPPILRQGECSPLILRHRKCLPPILRHRKCLPPISRALIPDPNSRVTRRAVRVCMCYAVLCCAMRLACLAVFRGLRFPAVVRADAVYAM